jgi:hypothetical protein
MKKYALTLLVFTLALVGSVQAQMSRIGSSGFSSATAKLFGENNAFSADLEIQMNTPGQPSTIFPGKIAFNAGKSRTEINLSEAKGAQMGPQFAAHMKSMGMDKTVTISLPEKKVAYVIYPTLSAYAETPLQEADGAKPDSAFKMESTELAKETLDGHPCVKNKVVVTDDKKMTHESIVWNATDLKKFPIKIETTEQGRTTDMVFKNVKIGKPDAALFEAPTDYKKYDSQQALMAEEMKKRMGNMTMPPGHP